jgi:hypothetical protein
MRDTETVSSPAATAVKNSLLALANRNFTQVEASPMPPVVVQPVVPPVVMANHQHLVSVVMSNITKQPALPADDLPPFHSFLVKIALFIAVTASRPSVPLVATVVTTHAATAEAPMAVAETAVVVVIAVIVTTIAILAGKSM